MTYQLPITPQQNRVLHLVAKGLSNKQIASELNISLATVKAHVSALLKRLQLSGRAQAASFVEQGFTERRTEA